MPCSQTFEQVAAILNELVPQRQAAMNGGKRKQAGS